MDKFQNARIKHFIEQAIGDMKKINLLPHQHTAAAWMIPETITNLEELLAHHNSVESYELNDIAYLQEQIKDIKLEILDAFLVVTNDARPFMDQLRFATYSLNGAIKLTEKV